MSNEQQVWKPAEAAQAIASKQATIDQLYAYIDEVTAKYKDDPIFQAEMAKLGATS